MRAPRRVLALPTYDIRMRKEIAQRRLLVAIARQTLRVVTLHALDAAVIVCAVGVAALVTALPEVDRIALPLAALVLVGLNARSAYNANDARRDPMRIVTGVIVAIAAVAITSLLPNDVMPPLNFLMVFSGLTVLGLMTERWLVDLAVRQAYARGIGLRKAVIVVRHGAVPELIAELTEDVHG